MAASTRQFTDRPDVAIVGAGVAGLTTALFCARAGLDVLVLEADRIGNGVTGHSTVKVTAAHGTAYSSIREKHGDDVTRVYGAANRWGMDEVGRLVSQVGIAGSSELGDYVQVAGQSGIGGHLKVGHRAQIAAKSAVLSDVPDDTKVMGIPAVPFREFARREAALRKLGKKP